MDVDDRVLISALEHFSYCPRQCALIHVEQVFEENVFTLQGSGQHARADEPVTTMEPGKRVERALPLWSDHWGVYGKADVVEFYPDGRVAPVEYKHGARQAKRHDDVQLCAQALCLEEMLGVTVARGMIFAHKSHRSREVLFTPELRAETGAMIAAVRALLESGVMPPPVNDARCTDCSLNAACQPEMLAAARRTGRRSLFALEEE